MAERKFWDQGLETQSRTDWEALQLRLLIKHLRQAYAGSAYYRTPGI